MLIDDETGKKMDAQTVFAESIKYLKNTFLEDVDTRGMKIKDPDVLYVLTVPAIWNDTAKQFMRNAAIQVWTVKISFFYCQVRLVPFAVWSW